MRAVSAKIACALLACLAGAGPLHGANASGEDFLLTEPTARDSGVGGAVTAVWGQLESLRYNPAGLSGMDPGLQLAVSHMSASDDWSNEWVGLGYSTGKLTFASELLISSLTPFTLYNAAGQAYDTATVGSQNFALAAAGDLVDWLHAGADLRVFHSQLYTYNSDGAALDAGLQVHKKRWPISAGMALENLGLASAYVSDPDPLPLLLRLGLAGDFDLNPDVHISPRLDLVQYKDPSRPMEWRLGADTCLYKQAFIRVGWVHTDSFDQPCLGLGVAWQNLAVDYSYQPGNVLGDNQLIELRLFSH